MQSDAAHHGRFVQGRAIRHVGKGLDVAPLLAEIAIHPGAWDQHRERTTAEAYSGAHKQVSDIWVRFNPQRNYTGDPAFFSEEHDSEWYPVCRDIPAVKTLVRKVMAIVGGERLGGVLITRIPPHGEVKPHVDHGWHPSYYDKYAVQLKGSKGQAFCFDGESLSAEPGDLYTFDNSHEHWVTNPTDMERMTLIICIRGNRFDD